VESTALADQIVTEVVVADQSHRMELQALVELRQVDDYVMAGATPSH
jgi:hypothetical protein